MSPLTLVPEKQFELDYAPPRARVRLTLFRHYEGGCGQMPCPPSGDRTRGLGGIAGRARRKAPCGRKREGRPTTRATTTIPGRRNQWSRRGRTAHLHVCLVRGEPFSRLPLAAAAAAASHALSREAALVSRVLPRGPFPRR